MSVLNPRLLGLGVMLPAMMPYNILLRGPILLIKGAYALLTVEAYYMKLVSVLMNGEFSKIVVATETYKTKLLNALD